MVAVIQTGGKQYCIHEGQKLFVDHLNSEAGSTVTVPDLLTKDSVTLEVVAHLLGKKVTTRKFRNKTRYHRVKGHRQSLTLVKVVTIGGKAAPVKKKAAKETAPEEAA